MSSNSNIELVNLDFASLKNSLKKYLANQDQFKDYDFEGSNMNVLIDILSYNTYMNSFYLNMIASEMFLDSAQIRDSIMSHAKELNYLPRSFRSSQATVNITITPSIATDTVTILKGTSFTSRVGSNTFTFVTNDNVVINSDVGVFVANNISLFEGELVSETFTYDFSNTVAQMIISNPTVDTESIEVYVYEDNGQTVIPYTKGTTFLGLQSNSQIFFIQPARNDRYEIVFGNGTQGRQPKDGSVVVVGYRVCNGELPNGAAIFAPDDAIDGHSNVVVTTLLAATGGSIHETNQSIKKNAPRFFQTQERAVTVSDYRVALQTQFPEIQNISVYGGEDADPPQFGRVFISVDLQNADGVPAYKKQIYKDYVKTITPLSIEPVFIDPEFMYVEVSTNVRFNLNTIQIPQGSLESLITNKIQIYNQINLNSFEATLRYSKLVADIDSADSSIISNETNTVLYKEITPSTVQENTYALNFYNVLEQIFKQQASVVHRSQDLHAVYSTPFVYENQLCRIEDDNVGRLSIVAITGDNHQRIKFIGSVEYNTGKVIIEKFRPSAFSGGAMRIYVVTKENDVNGLKNNILTIKPTDISVTTVGVRE
jgi:hypothetical protein